MARLYAFVNQKGGVGKTTTAVNLAAFLAVSGHRILLVDIDPQANATSSVGVDKSKVTSSVYDSLVNDAPPEENVLHSPQLQLALLPSAPALAGAEVEMVSMLARESQLRKALETIESHYDYILIDCPPSLRLLTLNGLVAARHGVIIPVQCEYYALEGLADLLATIQLVNANLKTRVAVMGALLTMYDRKSRLHRAVAKEIRRKFPGYVFGTMIPRNISLAEAPSFGKTILQYDPYSHGAKAYRQLAEEVLKLEGIRRV